MHCNEHMGLPFHKAKFDVIFLRVVVNEIPDAECIMHMR
jgi:hypothetical protein